MKYLLSLLFILGSFSLSAQEYYPEEPIYEDEFYVDETQEGFREPGGEYTELPQEQQYDWDSEEIYTEEPLYPEEEFIPYEE